jgi:undecaprenyl diphosphate synthase
MTVMRSKSTNAPAHVAVIPDGNRRWAKLHSLPLLLGYSQGIKRFVDFSLWCSEFGVKTLTVWGLSTDNLKGRTPLELKVLFRLYIKAATDKKLIKMLNDKKIKLRIIGNMENLPRALRTALLKVQRETQKYTDFTINLLINYGGREDLLYSVQGIKRELDSGNAGKIDADYLRSKLQTASIPDVDLIVRTSGEMRLSGLLPWQTAYSELYFAKKYWPEFEKEDFRKAIRLFSKRQRRFGK